MKRILVAAAIAMSPLLAQASSCDVMQELGERVWVAKHNDQHMSMFVSDVKTFKKQDERDFAMDMIDVAYETPKVDDSQLYQSMVNFGEGVFQACVETLEQGI